MEKLHGKHAKEYERALKVGTPFPVFRLPPWDDRLAHSTAFSDCDSRPSRTH
jgi:hypothetical protein